MQSISFPLEIINGDLAIDESIEEIIQSEILSILQTRKLERVFRGDYGTPNFLLKKLDLNYILIEINAALDNSLSGLGFAQILVEADSSLEELQSGIVNLVISYSINEELVEVNFAVDLNF